MLSNDIKKKICLFLTAALISSYGIVGFADEQQIPSPGENLPPVTDTQGSEEGESKDTEEEVVQTPINISANYFENGKNSYIVKFSSLDVIDSIKDLNFKIAFSGAEVKYPEFDSALKNNSSGEGVIGSNTAKFEHGAFETAVSGKVPFCSVTLNNAESEPTLDSVTFSEFTAKDKDGKDIYYNVTLTVNAGPVVPDLSEKAQKVYDMIIGLPDTASVSFYKDNALIDIAEFETQVVSAKEAFDALTAKEKEDIDAVLSYNMKNRDALNALPLLVTSMKSTYPVMHFSSIITSVKDTDMLGYRFIPRVYDKIKNSITTAGFPAGVKALSEYEIAKGIVASKGTALETAYSAGAHEAKIEAITTQLENAQKLSSDTYYKDYVEDILAQAKSLKKDVTDNYNGSYKEYMLSDISDLITRVELVQKGIGKLPTMKSESTAVSIGGQYTIDFSRTKASAVDAQIEIVVFLENKPENEIDKEEFNFAEGRTSLKASMRAFASKKYSAGKNIIVKAYYIVDGARLYLGDLTFKCKESTDPMKYATGIPKGESTSPQQSGGTKFPSGNTDKKEDKNNKDDMPEKVELFNDLARYDWAKESIEGLYYAGIVNGMEEGVFNPAGNVTREQFCKMAVQLFGVLQYETETDFDDVDPDAWYAQYINSAIRAGYVQGQSANYFGIGESIMRQDMAVILYRALGSQNSAAVLDFTDADAIAPYAEEAISELVGLGIINGYEDGSLNPRGTATRAEAAKMIWGVYNIINE